MAKPKYITVCPKCKSTNVGNDLSGEMVAWGGSTRMKCFNCGFSSVVFPEVLEPEVKNVKILKQTKEQKDVEREMSASKGMTLGGIKLGGWLFTVLGLAVCAVGVVVPAMFIGAVLPLGIGILLLWKTYKQSKKVKK